jgi:hypothetical protein
MRQIYGNPLKDEWKSASLRKRRLRHHLRRRHHSKYNPSFSLSFSRRLLHSSFLQQRLPQLLLYRRTRKNILALFLLLAGRYLW